MAQPPAQREIINAAAAEMQEPNRLRREGVLCFPSGDEGRPQLKLTEKAGRMPPVRWPGQGLIKTALRTLHNQQWI